MSSTTAAPRPAPADPQIAAFVARHIDAFMDASRVLLGADALALELPQWLGQAYLTTLVRGAELAAKDRRFMPRYSCADICDALGELTRIARDTPPQALERAIRDTMLILGDGRSVVLKSIVALWYCAALIDLTPPEQGGLGYPTLTADKATYAEALVWKTLGANPMGVPGAYFGNWSYPAVVALRPHAGSGGSQ